MTNKTKKGRCDNAARPTGGLNPRDVKQDNAVFIDEQPIIALCTPQGSGAIALIRITGKDVIPLVEKLAKLSSKKRLSEQESHTIHHGHIVDSAQNVVDEVLFFLMKAPKTFTGDDTIEISCHNNRFIINNIIKLAITHGAHHAQRGEFTKRAYLNKKVDLLQAEAINDLISAQTELALKKSMSQLKGTLSYHIKQIESELISLLSHVEASFEFLDEEQKDIALDAIIKKKLNKLLKNTNTILANFSQQQQIRQGIKIAILGNVNVGKSTLFNALVDKERAIVTNTPGTTRDAIETTLYHNGNFWLIIDTAGLRTTQNEIEQKGIDRSWQEAAESDIILLVFDASRKGTALHEGTAMHCDASREDTAFDTCETSLYKKIKDRYPKKIIMVANKIDQLPQAQNLSLVGSKIDSETTLTVSAKNNIGIDKLKQTIEEKIKKLFKKAESPFLLNQRQHDLILELNIKLKKLEKDVADRIEYELVAYHLNQTLELTAQLTGKTINEEMMNTVFKTFCVGK